MPRRVTPSSGGPGKRPTMPGADELFRATAPAPAAEDGDSSAAVAASGRVKHDEKMTVYVTAAELLAVEQASWGAASTAAGSYVRRWPWHWPTSMPVAPTATSPGD